MSYTTILAGLSEIKEFWSTADMLRYLLLLVGLDAASGLYISIVVERCEIFTLPRSGYARWYRRATLGNSGVMLLLLALITVITCLISSDSVQTVVLAAGILALNLTLISNIQLFIMLVSHNIGLGYLICMLIQLASLFCSERFPQAGKLLLIGNWGMMARSTLVQSDGVPIGIVVGTEIGILVVLWVMGWRILRKIRRGG